MCARARAIESRAAIGSLGRAPARGRELAEDAVGTRRSQHGIERARDPRRDLDVARV
jgi:hypothetical protein